MSTRAVLSIAAALCALALPACGDDDEDADAPAEPPRAGQDAGACKDVAAPEPRPRRKLSKPTLTLDPERSYEATVETSCGDFTIALDAERAPRTGGSFVTLAKRGFYDGLTVHRIVPGFVVQGGDPQGTGMGGPGFGMTERPPPSLAYRRGVVAMAKAGDEPAGRSGSQFFVVVGEDAQLPPDYALLGTVSDGLDAVDRIAATPIGPDDQPIDPIVIESIEIEESAAED